MTDRALVGCVILVAAVGLVDVCLGRDDRLAVVPSRPAEDVRAPDAAPTTHRAPVLRRIVLPPFGEARITPVAQRDLYARALGGDVEALDEYLTDVELQLAELAVELDGAQ